VDNSALVCRAHPVGQRHGELKEPVEGHPLGRDQVREWPAFDQLHGQERYAVGLLDGVDRDDVGMIERGHGPGLALESVPAIGILVELRWKDLEGDCSPQLRVFGGVDLAHAALAQPLQDPIVAERLTDYAGLVYSPSVAWAERRYVPRRGKARVERALSAVRGARPGR
jgi:hypothetical protein